MIEYIFFLIFFASIISLIVGLIKPSVVKMKSRKSASIVFGTTIVASFILLAVTIPSASKSPTMSGQQSSQEQSSFSNSTDIEKIKNDKVVDPEIINNATAQQIITASEPTATKSEVSASNQSATLYNVVKVVDGDTIDVSINGETKRLRLIGINTPETVDPRTPVECFGREASDKTKSLLTGKKVSLETDSTQGELDKYSRLLRYVFLENGTNFNLYMIKEGYAYEYTYNTAYKYQKEFKEAQAYAKTNNKGLWSPTTCNGELKSAEPQITNTSSSTSSFGSCGTKTTCSQMTTCEEARYFLNTCGVTRLDGDSDGVPCQTTVCKN